MGNYDALKAQLPDVSGSFNIMSQADLDATMNSYSAEIQSKYQSSINSAQANAQSSSAEAMANISARAQSIQSGVDPDTGEAYSDYIANNTPSYDADAWLASATANISSNISTLRGIVGDAEMPENQLWAGVQDSYNQAVDSYNSMEADFEAHKGTSISNSPYELALDDFDAFRDDTLANEGEDVYEWQDEDQDDLLMDFADKEADNAYEGLMTPK